VALCIVPVAGIATVIILDWFSLKDINNFVDAALKVGVALIGAAWALNRLFTTRADAPQLRVDGSACRVEGAYFGTGSRDDLVLCHIEATNTGKTLLSGYTWSLNVHVVRPGDDERLLAMFPAHTMPPIEPGSWAAIDLSTPSPTDVAVVRLLVEVLDSSNELTWTWHHTYSLVPTTQSLTTT
jgi:hypothetical protein